MRRAVLAAVVALLAAASPALADPPSRVTIVAVFNPIAYGENAYVNGQLLGDGQAGQPVALEQAAPPFTEWTPVAQATTDFAGYYSFKLRPSQTMQYRTSAAGVPSDSAVQVGVKPRIKLSAKAAGKTSVRFSGSFAPALPGQSVAIQRRESSGAWTTLANVKLQGGGKTFGGRVRARHAIVLRALFVSDGAHLDGFSNAVRAAPGTASASAAGHASAAAVVCGPPRISRVAWKPDPPLAGSAATLRVTGELAAGRVYAIDVVWGEGDARDHFTLAPAYRKPTVTFALRHRYRSAKAYRVTLRVYAIRNGCKSSAVRSVRLTVAAPH